MQYRDKPNASRHVTAIVKGLMIFDSIKDLELSYGLVDNLDENVKKSQGVFLDIIAKYTGVKREVVNLDSPKHFGARDYDESATSERILQFVTGSVDYGQTEVSGRIWSYESRIRFSLSQLEDDELRLLIKMKGLINTGNMSLGFIDDFFNRFFPGKVKVKEYLMRLTFDVDKSEERIMRIAHEQNILPKPAGVHIEDPIYTDVDVFSLFTYDADVPNKNRAGLIDYKQTPGGTMLQYYNEIQETQDAVT